jgi:hypothetical protein
VERHGAIPLVGLDDQRQAARRRRTRHDAARQCGFRERLSKLTRHGGICEYRPGSLPDQRHRYRCDIVETLELQAQNDIGNKNRTGDDHDRHPSPRPQAIPQQSRNQRDAAERDSIITLILRDHQHVSGEDETKQGDQQERNHQRRSPAPPPGAAPRGHQREKDRAPYRQPIFGVREQPQHGVERPMDMEQAGRHPGARDCRIEQHMIDMHRLPDHVRAGNQDMAHPDMQPVQGITGFPDQPRPFDEQRRRTEQQCPAILRSADARPEDNAKGVNDQQPRSRLPRHDRQCCTQAGQRKQPCRMPCLPPEP